MNIALYKLDSKYNINSERNYADITDLIKITHDVHGNAKAVMSINGNHKEIMDTIKYCAIEYNDKRIFTGKIKSVYVQNNLIVLHAISEACEEDIKKAFDQDQISEVFNPNKRFINDILIFDSNRNVYNLNQFAGRIYDVNLDDDKVYSKKLSYADKDKSRCVVNIKWNEYRYDIVTDSLNIPREHVGDIEKVKLPQKWQRFGDYHMQSCYINQDKLRFQFTKEKQICKLETWQIGIYVPNIKDFNIYLNGDKYVEQYTTWKSEAWYEVGDQVEFEGKIYRCILTHASEDVFDDQCWVFLNKVPILKSLRNGFSLFASDSGQDLFQQLLKLLHCHICKNGYKYAITVSGPAKHWAYIQIMDQIRFKDINMNDRLAHVFSYEKVFQYNEEHVTFKLHFLECDAPARINKLTYATEEYFAENYVNVDAFQDYDGFICERIYGRKKDFIQLVNERKYDFEFDRTGKQIIGLKIIDSADHDQNFDEVNVNLYKKA